MQRGLLAFVACFCLLLAACNRPQDRNTLEIKTRAGQTFLIADAKANYLRICWEGQVDLSTLEDYTGLRTGTPPKSEDDGFHHGEELPWSDVDSISFGATHGDLGEFCPGLPWTVSGEVHRADGKTEQREFEDTTDDGIWGLSERGRVTVPLRNVASLRRVPDQHWPWSEDTATDVQYLTTLRPVHGDGSTDNFDSSFSVSDGWNKQKGDEYLSGPTSSYVDGLPASIGGAKVDIPWRMLKSVDLEPIPNSDDMQAKVTFADGHVEQFQVRHSVIESGQTSVIIDNLKHIDVSTKTEPMPKLPS